MWRILKKALAKRRSTHLKLISRESYSPISIESTPDSVTSMKLETSDCSDTKAIGRFCNHSVPWLCNYSPEFAISGKQVEVLKEPSAFFERLKDLSRTATQRITLASLYIGTGPLEQQLVSSIHDGLAESRDGLKVKILMDYTRGSRGKENSRTLLLPLLRLFPTQLQVSLYHTPKLRGLIKWILPERWNETIGLTHLKVYLFDNTLMLSGANLSDQYFTNRQDRYVLFHDCKQLADFFDNLVSTVSMFSLQLQTDNSVALHPKWKVHPVHGNYKEFITQANKALRDYIVPESLKSQSKTFSLLENSKDLDTFVYPLLQMHPLGVVQEEQVVTKLLQTAESAIRIKLASGYFNLTRQYMKIILNSSKASYDLLVASPKVNGFYGAKGVAGAIPNAYAYIAKQFYQRILRCQQVDRVKLHEYEREDWTFHVKGLWYYIPEDELPIMSLIGSPNFGYRSIYKDLEAQVAIVTSNRHLQMNLQEEQQRLYQRTIPVTEDTFKRPECQVPFWVKVVTFLILDYF